MRLNTAIICTLLGLGLTGIASSAAQQNRVSPHERADATVDGAEMSLTYGRPSMRGRVVMGRLVPYDRVWCPGADEATQLTTSKGLQIGDVRLPAGSYTLWMLPSATDWTLIVSSAVNVFHTQYASRFDLGRIPLEKTTLDAPVEQLTFTIDSGSAPGAGGVIAMAWETTRVAAAFSVVE